MVKLNTEFNVDDARHVLTNFAQLVGHSQMMRALDKVRAEIDGRRAISAGLLKRYQIPIGLHRAYTYRKATGRARSPLKDPYSFAACTFAYAALSVADCLTPKGKERLAGMVWQGLGLDGDLRRLQHEFTVAAHFVKNGWDVEFVDLEGRERFDYIVRKAAMEAEVECKTISADKGNAIHMRESLTFLDIVCEPMLVVFDEGWWTVDMTFDARLPKGQQAQLALGRELARCMMDGRRSHSFPGGTATLAFNPLPSFPGRAELEEFANATMHGLQERLNGHAEVIVNSRRMLAMGASSARRSRVVEYSYDDIREGCEHLSQTRAGGVWTAFLDITDGQMRELAESKTDTALEVFSTRIFREPNRSHVNVLAYTGEGSVRKATQRSSTKVDTYYSNQGTMRSHRNLRATFPLPENEFPGIHRLR